MCLFKSSIFFYFSNLTFESFTLVFALTSCPCLNNFSSRIWSQTALTFVSEHEQDIANLQLALDSRVYSVDAKHLLKEFYSLENGKIFSKIVGRLDGNNSRKEIDKIWQRRSNLSQLKIKVVYAQSPPYLEVLSWKNGFVFEGVLGGTFDLLQQKLGFQYSVTKEENGEVRMLSSLFFECKTKEVLKICFAPPYLLLRTSFNSLLAARKLYNLC